MTLAVTLIAGGDAGSLDAALVDAALGAAGTAAGRADGPDWLSPGRACDLVLPGGEPAAVETAVRAALGDAPIDLVVQPGEGRRKRLLLADMDSTIVTGETLDDLAMLAGVAEQVVPVTRRAMNGEIGFAEAVRQRVALLAGHPADLLDRALAATRLTDGARSLVRTMRANGAHCRLISGGFRVFVDRVADWAGFDAAEGNVLLVEDGRLVGRVAEPILGKERKLEALREAAAAHGLSLDDTLAVGDGANDLPMLMAAGLGVAFRAKPSVRAQARARIDHADLTALLYMQGYRDAEIVRD